MDIEKSSGLILHPTSLPSKYGIGDLGKESYEFVDILYDSKTKIWQVLPLGITDNIEYSPYSSKSSILGNPYIISLDEIENQIFSKNELEKIIIPNSNEVDYKKVYNNKDQIFKHISKRVNIDEKDYQTYIENKIKKKHITFLTLSEIFDTSWNMIIKIIHSNFLICYVIITKTHLQIIYFYNLSSINNGKNLNHMQIDKM